MADTSDRPQRLGHCKADLGKRQIVGETTLVSWKVGTSIEYWTTYIVTPGLTLTDISLILVVQTMESNPTQISFKHYPSYLQSSQLTDKSIV